MKEDFYAKCDACGELELEDSLTLRRFTGECGRDMSELWCVACLEELSQHEKGGGI